MLYKAILINKQDRYVAGDDFLFTFVLVDENGDYLSDLSGWEFESTFYSLANSIPNSYITIITSGNKIYVSIPNSATEDLNSNVKYILILKGSLSDKDYSLSRETFYVEDEILD